MAYIFQKIMDRGNAAGINSSSIESAREWYRGEASKIARASPTKLMSDKTNIVSDIDATSIGKMFMFFYDPKHKDTLPYYDTFPLVFPIGLQNSGFLGINLHYLPQYARAGLMNSLYDTLNNKKYDSTSRLRVSYDILNNYSKFSAFKPCVKSYLYSQVVGGQYLNVQIQNWDAALMLPTERFVKARKDTVHKDSMRRK
jgi:hypothetical protein